MNGPDGTRDQELLEANLRALRTRSPDYADVLSAISGDGRYIFEATESAGAITCRDLQGVWLHGPEDPSETARREAEQIVADEPALYVALRPGLGYLPIAILDVLDRRGRGSIVLIAEDRLEVPEFRKQEPGGAFRAGRAAGLRDGGSTGGGSWLADFLASKALRAWSRAPTVWEATAGVRCCKTLSNSDADHRV